MSKMGSHNPFGHLTHKLWPKERSEIKSPIWLPTTKSQKLPQFPCVQVAYDILLKSSRQGLELFFKLHFNRRFTHKIMGPQSCKSQFWKFQDSHLGVSGQNVFWVLFLWPGIKYNITGKVVASPKSRLWWILWVRSHSWFILTPKVFQLCINQLVGWFCASLCEWLMLLIRVSPIPKLQYTPLPSKCRKPGSVLQLLTLLMSSL
jgi:hypothetical protein